jgi:hypothetical protein
MPDAHFRANDAIARGYDTGLYSAAALRLSDLRRVGGPVRESRRGSAELRRWTCDRWRRYACDV